MSASLRSPFDEDDEDHSLSAVEASSKAAPARASSRHRRNRTSVTNEDLISFREKVLGIPREDQPPIPGAEPREDDDDFSAINAAVAAFSMSVNQDVPVPSSTPPAPSPPPAAGSNPTGASPSTAGLFANLVEPGKPGNVPGQLVAYPGPRTPSPASSGPALHNGTPAMNINFPMNAGHQMDLNHLYSMVNELSEVLKNNRDLTSGIIKSAEDIARRSATEGTTPSVQEVNGEINATRIAELERALAREKQRVQNLRHEQVENMKLIAEYETAVGTMVEQIRNYCCNNEGHFLQQKRRYNDLLQAERDAHLASRLDRDHWHAQTMKCAEMIRTAYRLRCEEEVLPLRIVAGLQNEVRAYRNALGMDPEKPEEEWGWEILKDAPPGVE